MSDLDLYALLRMSRTAADLGHYNLGKLLNAAAASLANRSLYAESLPKTDRELAEAVSQTRTRAARRRSRSAIAGRDSARARDHRRRKSDLL